MCLWFLKKYKQKSSGLEEINGSCHVFADSCWAILIGWRRIFGHFPADFLFPLKIAHRHFNSLWAFPSGFSIPF
jgi:hypothetical protein